ncbi:MAG TPA: sigma-70 family RNA polymerase sigma factor, partial [Longimicrobium sp.]|nr:sigma-70 family RNA polymerase sigma factor [Longimicrobium sp.]
FASWAKMKLIENDYASLRKYRGESTFASYLIVVLSMLFRDYRVREWGRWRPSAVARRLGPDAVELERLVHRDGVPVSQAINIHRSRSGTSRSDRELMEVLHQLPARNPLRPRRVDDEALFDAASGARADDILMAAETDAERENLLSELRKALDTLPSDDAQIITMRFVAGLTIAEIARALELQQKPLYRRAERILKTLRDLLEAAGISAHTMRGLVLEPEDE